MVRDALWLVMDLKVLSHVLPVPMNLRISATVAENSTVEIAMTQNFLFTLQVPHDPDINQNWFDRIAVFPNFDRSSLRTGHHANRSNQYHASGKRNGANSRPGGIQPSGKLLFH